MFTKFRICASFKHDENVADQHDVCKSNLHECTYDFNDDILPIGASLFAELVETLQPLSS